MKKYKKVIAVDIDDTICEPSPDQDYAKAKPRPDKIRIVNELYEAGCYVYYYTSRGTLTGLDWQELTLKQLENWGCKFHSLLMKKPYYDYIIDDRALSIDMVETINL